jgi:hypothetical protein
MTNASNDLRRTLCNFSGRSKDGNVAVCHSDRRAMRGIENDLGGTEQSITIRNRPIDRIITWYRSDILINVCLQSRSGKCDNKNEAHFVCWYNTLRIDILKIRRAECKS